MLVRTCVALAAATLFAGVAHAAPLTADEMLRQFNVVVKGDMSSTSHVDGRTYVAGNLQGGGYVQHASDTARSAYAGLTVGGNASGNLHVNGLGAVVGGNANGIIVNAGQTYVGGSATATTFNGNAWVAGAATGVNFNGAGHAARYTNTNNNNKLASTTAVMNSTRAAAGSTDFSNVMNNMSKKLAALKGSQDASVAIAGNKVTFSGSGNANGVLVFDLTALDSQIFASNIGEFAFDLTKASTVIFNTDNQVLSLSANILAANSLGSSLIWNFAGATSVTVDRTFVGQVLVADGMFSNRGGANVEGGVYAKAFDQRGEVHLQQFSGSLATAVPEAQTYAMMLAGLGLLGCIARRRKSA